MACGKQEQTLGSKSDPEASAAMTGARMGRGLPQECAPHQRH